MCIYMHEKIGKKNLCSCHCFHAFCRDDKRGEVGWVGNDNFKRYMNCCSFSHEYP